jgi:hypothetical protein
MIIPAPAIAVDNDATLAFRTHLNYLEAFNTLLDQRLGFEDESQLAHLYGRIKASGLCEADRRNNIDEDALKKSLSHAWGIERLLYANQEAASDDIVLRLANNWACIQAYYVLYHATQALLIAKGQPRYNSHATTQNSFINLWADRGVDLAPWTFVRAPVKAPLTPAWVQLNDKIHNLYHCDDSTAWSLCYKALRTTREEYRSEALDKKRKDKQRERRKAWEKEEQTRQAAGRDPRKPKVIPLPQLTPEEKNAVDGSLRPYSVMDYLYRLRIKANYEDADMFVDGPTVDTDSLRVYTCLCNLASATLFLSELSIISIWGKKNLIDYHTSWHSTRKVELTEPGLWDRTAHLISHVPR